MSEKKKQNPIRELVEKESQKKEVKENENSEVEEPEFDTDFEQGFIVTDEEKQKNSKEVSDNVEIAKTDERFRTPSRSNRQRQRDKDQKPKKALDKKFKKSQKKETRIKKWYSVKNWLKSLFRFDERNPIVKLIYALFEIMDVLLKASFIIGMSFGLILCIHYLYIGNWVMSLVSILFVSIMAIINDKLM